jgi:hypothetical protein
MKKQIRLSENDLHRIIRACVNEALNEIQYNGQSFHGDNADDWNTLATHRLNNNDKDTDTVKNFTNSLRDMGNASDLNRSYYAKEKDKVKDRADALDKYKDSVNYIQKHNRFLKKK